MGTKVKATRNRPQPTASTITERKQVEKALPYSEQYFRPLIERALDVVVVLNSDGTVRYESPSFQNVTGYKPEERQGKSIFDLIHPDDMASATSAFSQLLQTQAANVHIELRLRHKDGSWRSIEAVGQNLLDDPTVAGIVVNFRDITERKRADEALRGSEERYRMLAENISDVIWTMDMDRRFTYVSPSTQHMLGYTPEEEINIGLANILTPESLEVSHKAYERGLAAEKSRVARRPFGSMTVELNHIHKNGSIVPAEVRMTFLRDDDGKPIGILGITRDITERKQAEEALRESEQKYKTILEDIEDGYYEVDSAGNFTFFNDPMCGIIGYSKDEMMGMNNRQYLDKENAKKVYQAFNRVYATGKHTEEFGWEIIRKDGAKRFIEASVSPKRNSEGEPIGFRGIVRDITERKMAEEALRNSEERYRLLAENVRDVITSTDMNLKPTYMSPSYTRLLGYSVEEAMARTMEESLTPASREVAVKSLAQQLFREHDGGGKRSSLPRAELEFYHKDGSTVWVEVSVAFLRNSNGEPVGLVNLLRDITDRRQAEEALSEKEELFRALIENSSDAIAVVSGDGIIRYESPSVERILGYKPEELIGKDVLQFIHPDDVQLITKAFAMSAENPRRTLSTEVRFLHRDGSWRVLEGVGNNLLDDPKVNGIVANYRDVTERKQAEEALRDSEEHYSALVGSLTDAVFKFKGGVVNWCNDSVERIYGYKKEELIGKEASFFYPDNVSVTEFRKAVSADIKKRGFFLNATTFQKKDGSTVDIGYSISQIPGKDPIELVAVARDITDQVQAQEEIRKLNEELEQRVIERTTQLQAVNKELEAFAYSVSHDLRAPLRSIDGFSQVLLEDYSGKLDKEGKDYLQRVRSASQRMAELIDDILNLSRLTRSEMRRKTVDLSALAQAIATELRQSQPERQVEFIITSGLATKGDAHLLRVALENLLDNAWKFTKKQPRARIEFGYAETNGQSAYFVRDNGIGFDMAYADKLFGAFQRLHLPSEYEGTGIGLATVQRIIHRHGGNIWAESAVDQGATFYFTL